MPAKEQEQELSPCDNYCLAASVISLAIGFDIGVIVSLAGCGLYCC